LTRHAQAAEQERRYEELRLRMRHQHTAVTNLADDSDAELTLDFGLAPAVEELVAATDDLLAFEDRLPVLLDLPARALSVQVVHASALAALLSGALIGLGIWRGVLGWGWLPIIMITELVALLTATLSVAPAAGEHRRQRYAAAGCGCAGLMIGPGAVWWGWFAGLTFAAIQLLCLAVLSARLLARLSAVLSARRSASKEMT
jgi:hypothetical protein